MSYITYEVRVYDGGGKEWYQNGQLHRTDGPASEYADGSKEWHQNGKRHRTDGPAIEYADGDKFWYLEGQELTEAEFNAKSKPSFEVKVVEIDGKKYTLAEIV